MLWSFFFPGLHLQDQFNPASLKLLEGLQQGFSKSGLQTPGVSGTLSGVCEVETLFPNNPEHSTPILILASLSHERTLGFPEAVRCVTGSSLAVECVLVTPTSPRVFRVSAARCACVRSQRLASLSPCCRSCCGVHDCDFRVSSSLCSH